MQSDHSPLYNPRLQHWDRKIPTKLAGKGIFEKPGETTNIIWQTRARIPTVFELALLHEVQEAYDQDASTVGDLVQHLNKVGVFDEIGKAWTAESLASYIAKVGY